VWITGMGTISAIADNVEGLRAALADSIPAPGREVDRKAGYHRRGGSRTALLATAPLGTAWLSAGEARRMSPPSRLAVAAARQAVAAAGCGAEVLDQAAIFLSTAFGPSTFSEGLLRQVLLEDPEAASPFFFTESVANAPAAQVAIAVGAHGPNVTICQREAGALIALGRAAAAIRSGRTAVAITGSVDELSPLLHALLDRFGSLARGAKAEREVSRPFDRRRNGFLAAEGATVVVLEDAEVARARGARPLAEVRGWGSGFDPTARPHGWGHGAADLAAAIGSTLWRCDATCEDVRTVVTGASGSRGGDRLEGQLLRSLWGDCALPRILAPKGLVGEYGGGHLASIVLAAQGAVFGPTVGFDEADLEIGIEPDRSGGALPTGPVLATSVAAGGSASWALLSPA
jgi:3-oxoacyl-[acyl-carrier-protein] synthase II